MITKEKLLKSLKLYDENKYPFGIYKDLVVDGVKHPRKIELMGAWKTGSLRIDKNGKEYIDKNGVRYTFTSKWSKFAPVGFEVWNDISNKSEEVKRRIPRQLSFEKPEIIKELQSQKGFGFIWTLFVMHCFYPEEYPLFDQHVYRAYKYISTKGQLCPNSAPDSWSEYLNYKSFFNGLLAKYSVPFWQLDRALWAYGKQIKHYASTDVGKKVSNNDNNSYFHDELGEDGWVHSTTLGGKAKVFYWKIDKSYGLHIKREFKSGTCLRIITKEELERLDEYMAKKEWVSLANNIEKLNNGTEKNGLGKFLYESLGWPVTDCQLASHLGAIFALSGAWLFNGRKKGIQFKKRPINWEEQLKIHYYRELSDDV